MRQEYRGETLGFYQRQYGDQSKNGVPAQERGQLRCALTAQVAEREPFADRLQARINARPGRGNAVRPDLKRQKDKHCDYEQRRRKRCGMPK